jgi:hypothetical protein
MVREAEKKRGIKKAGSDCKRLDSFFAKRAKDNSFLFAVLP